MTSKQKGFVVGAAAALVVQLAGFLVATWAKELSFLMLGIIYVACPPSLLGVFVPDSVIYIVFFRICITLLNGVLYAVVAGRLFQRTASRTELG
jgi:hypothetical protein